jgi:hypothetical protein
LGIALPTPPGILMNRLLSIPCLQQEYRSLGPVDQVSSDRASGGTAADDDVIIGIVLHVAAS